MTMDSGMREMIIRHEATLIRHTLEEIAHTLEGLQSFPGGACGNASVLLGEWLVRKGVVGLEYVSGSSHDVKSHAWLECYGLIIDITADQFGVGMPPVFVGRERCFHDSLREQSRHVPLMDGAYDKTNYAALESHIKTGQQA